jgi:hypothetical protein
MQALLDNAQALPHFLYPDTCPVIAIAIITGRYVKFKIFVA